MCGTGYLAYVIVYRSLEAHEHFFTRRVFETPSNVQTACYQGEDVLLDELQYTLGSPKGVLHQNAWTLIEGEIPHSIDEARLNRVTLTKPSEPPSHLQNLTVLREPHAYAALPYPRHPQGLQHDRQDQELLVLRKARKVEVITKE